MGIPTKNAVIGQFVNGRNAQDDFLQLATNHGGTVFAWIDYQGNLMGTFAVGNPGGSNTNVQFNNNGILGGDNGFNYVSSNPSPSLTNISTLLISGNGVGQSIPVLEIQGTGTGQGNGPVVLITPVSGAGNTGATRATFLEFDMDASGGGGFTFTQNNRAGGGVTFQGTAGTTPGALEVGIFGISNNNALTEFFYVPDGGINVFLNNTSGIADISMAVAGTSWVNPAAATSMVNQDSPALVLTGQAWVTSPGPASQTVTYSIQNKNGVLQFTQTAGPGPSQFPFQFNGQVNFTGTTLFGTADFGFQTGNGGAVYTITSVANAVGALTTYTFTTVGSGGQPTAGQNITIAGFVTGANNGKFVVQTATTSTVTVYNSSGASETHAATGTLDTNYDSSIGQYSAQLAVTSSNNFPIEGTSYLPNNVFNSFPNAPLFVMNQKGNSVDAAYVRILNDGVTGNHGLEIGSIIDSTGTAPVTLQLGHFNGNSSLRLGQPIAATGGANQSSNFLAIEGKYWTGSVSAADVWSFQDSLGAGANPSSTLFLSHAGSGGSPLFSIGTIALTCGPVNCQTISLGGNIDFAVASATGGGNVNSYLTDIRASWWDGAAAQTSVTSIQEIMGAGTNPTTDTLVISNSGSHAWSGVSVLGILTGQTLIESNTHTPSSAADTGTTGQIAWDASFIYICTAPNTWKRVGIATW